MKRIGILFFTALFCVVAVAALAAGDVAKGEALSKGCACHRSRGDLNGQDVATLTAKMQAFKEGKGANKAMIAIMQKHSEADIADLSAYYASLPKK